MKVSTCSLFTGIVGFAVAATADPLPIWWILAATCTAGGILGCCCAMSCVAVKECPDCTPVIDCPCFKQSEYHDDDINNNNNLSRGHSHGPVHSGSDYLLKQKLIPNENSKLMHPETNYAESKTLVV